MFLDHYKSLVLSVFVVVHLQIASFFTCIFMKELPTSGNMPCHLAPGCIVEHRIRLDKQFAKELKQGGAALLLTRVIVRHRVA